MLVERIELEKTLKKIIARYRPDKVVIDNIEESLYQKGVSFGNKLLAMQTPLETQSIPILYLLTNNFYKFTNDREVDPTKFFTESEINQLKDFKFESEEKEDGKIIFKDFIQLDEDRWLGSLTNKQIKMLWERGIATYNKDTQRNTIWTQFHGSIIEEVNLNKKSVDEIDAEIQNNTYIPVAPIVFNILRDGTEDFEFVDGNLMFYKGKFNCTDGFHRSMGIISSLIEKPFLELNFPVMITNFDEAKARKMIGQEQKKNDLSDEYAKTLEDTYANKIVRELNARKGEMQGKVGSDITTVKYGMAYTTHSILMMAVDENFKMESERDVRKVYDYLIKGFNEIIGILKEKGEIEKNHYSSVAMENMMFIGYVALLGKLYKDENWIEKLEEVMNSIDFSNDNEKWREIGIFVDSTKVSSKRVRNISKYFKGLIK